MDKGQHMYRLGCVAWRYFTS